MLILVLIYSQITLALFFKLLSSCSSFLLLFLCFLCISLCPGVLSWAVISADPAMFNSSLLPVSAVNSGDVLHGYILDVKLNNLGIKAKHIEDYEKFEKFLTLPHINSSKSDESESVHRIQIVSEIRMKNNSECLRNGTFCLNEHIFRGGHGEVWRAHKVSADGVIFRTQSFILKRMHIKGNDYISKCALREIFYGEATKKIGLDNFVARYETFFKTDEDYWWANQTYFASIII